MRTLLLFLMLLAPLAAAEPIEPSVVFGTTALLAKENALGVIFSPESERIGLIDGKQIRYWNLANGKFAGECIHDVNDCNSRLCVSSDGRSIASTDNAKDKPRLVHFVLGEPSSQRKNFEFRPEKVIIDEFARRAAAEFYGGVRVLNVADSEVLVEFPGISGLRRFSASSDGLSFAFCDRDGKINVRSAGGPAWSPPMIDRQYASVAFSADGARLAVAPFSEDARSGTKSARPIQIWSMKTQRVQIECEAVDWFAEFPNRLRFTPDGKTLLAGDGAYLRGWDTATGKLTFFAQPGWNYPGPLMVSPNGRYVAVTYARRAMVWDLTTGQAPPGFEGHTGPVWELAFSPDGKLAATSSYGLTHVLVWEAATGRFVNDLYVPYTEGSELTARMKKYPNQTGLAADPNPDKLNIIPGRLRILFSRDGRHLATVNEATGTAGPIRMWDAVSGKKLWELPINRAFAPEVAFTDKGLIAALYPSPAHFDLTTGQRTWTSQVVLQAVSFQVNRRGTLVVIGEKSGEKNPIIDSATGQLVEHCEGVPHSFTPDGRGLVLIRNGPGMTKGFFHDVIALRDPSAKTEREIGKVPMGTAAGKLSPEGEYRVVVREEGSKAFEFREVAGDRRLSIAYRVDANQSEAMNNWGTEHRPKAFCFSADGRLFASVYGSGVLAVWDVATGESVLVAPIALPDPKFVAFAPDGRTVFTASGEGSGGPVYGFDTTGSTVTAAIGGPSANARKAIYALAAKPAEALAAVKAILAGATEMQRRQYDAWIVDLAAPAFADREAAMKGLAEAGWRVEANLKEALATTPSEEARQRLTALLSRPDVRPLRAVHLLELINNDDAKKLLANLAAATPETFTTREAKRALARMAP